MAKSKDILVRFGARVRALRSQRDWSQEDLAFECELDRSYIGGIERGERNVSLRNIERIAKTLGVTVGQLMESL